MTLFAKPAIRTATCCALATLGLSSPSAQALTFVDELTYYLTSTTFYPGNTVSTRLTLATNPGISLSAFSFTLTWDSDLATPVATGPGSIADFGDQLALHGSLEMLPGPERTATVRWMANALEPSGDVIPVPYANPLQPVFAFQTDPAIQAPFVVSVQFFDIADGQGATVDTGSGWINWATLTPIPEPARVALWMLGLAGLLGWRAKQSRNSVGQGEATASAVQAAPGSPAAAFSRPRSSRPDPAATLPRFEALEWGRPHRRAVLPQRRQ